MKGLNFYTYQWPEDSGEWRFIIRKGDEAVELLPDELDRLISVIGYFKKREKEAKRVKKSQEEAKRKSTKKGITR